MCLSFRQYNPIKFRVALTMAITLPFNSRKPDSQSAKSCSVETKLIERLERAYCITLHNRDYGITALTSEHLLPLLIWAALIH